MGVAVLLSLQTLERLDTLRAMLTTALKAVGVPGSCIVWELESSKTVRTGHVLIGWRMVEPASVFIWIISICLLGHSKEINRPYLHICKSPAARTCILPGAFSTSGMSRWKA